MESQRMQLWASRFGKAEEFMDELGKRHFTEAKSASDRATLLEVCRVVGLDAAAAEAFLETDELRDEVWASYGDTINKMGIRSIPLFLFSEHPEGGPFRQDKGLTTIHNGSGSPAEFLAIFEKMWAHQQRE
mmetsp:Transcript_28049/g.89487  ORF Transcript_28049/g.89487 Transcript_28049/m.89487 type:complete len:131 (-) Transcript_28049:308-700(-)